ncbi:MAG: hypothetical protein KGY61_03180 [Desulfobacterales bacterium]|nr:hypothetical protein [Desulfobacterales bacterium]
MTGKDNDAEKSLVEKTGEELFNYAVDREDVKWLMDYLPNEADISRNTVEYELQLLKIVAVGWSISYFLENSSRKKPILEVYWQAVNEYAQNLSSTTGMMIGQDIDYFQVLKGRLDTYVDALSRNPEAPEPATVIGPEFASICGNKDDMFTYMTGAKMFLATLTNVRKYLEAVEV